MKKYIFIHYLLIVGVVLFSGCTDDFESINETKKEVKTIDIKYLLPTIQTDFMWQYAKDDVNDNVTLVMAQYFSQASYGNESNYIFREGMRNAYLEEMYRVILHCTTIMDLVAENDDLPEAQKNGWRLIATTLKVNAYQVVTDAYGPAIYSEAMSIESPTPAYDTQKEVYEGLMKELSDASKAVNGATDVDIFVGAQDLIYGGDIAQWQKYANSLLLRLCMRVSAVDAALSKQYFAMAIAPANGGVFTSNSDNALLPYGDSPSGNPLFETTFNSYDRGLLASSTMFDLQNRVNDPRKLLYWDSWQDQPLKYGDILGGEDSHWNYTSINPDLVGYKKYTTKVYGKVSNLPGIFMDYAEVELFLAEAAVRNYTDAGDAKAHYEAGISASINYYLDFLQGDYAADIPAYLTGEEVLWDNFTTSAQQLDRIGEEKYLALYLQGPEAWAEVRRLGRHIMQNPAGKTEADFPTRMQFSPQEWTINEANLNNVLSDLDGGDLHNSKVWWDIN